MKRIVSCLAVVLALLLSAVTEAQTISAERAHDLATTYMMRYISLCGLVEEAVPRSTYWELPIRVGQGAEPAGAIHVDKRSGIVSYRGHPTATPKSLVDWEKSLEKRRK
jgi:hypothetical protein